MNQPMTSHHHSNCQPCPVCGSSAIETDEVECRGGLLLGECLRCEHRWTAALALPGALHDHQRVPASQARGVWAGDREVASAA